MSKSVKAIAFQEAYCVDFIIRVIGQKRLAALPLVAGTCGRGEFLTGQIDTLNKIGVLLIRKKG